jgi:hypothetical protein
MGRLDFGIRSWPPKKQIAANRANATRSTGPRSAVGELRSSRNAHRQGLACPLPVDRPTSERIEALTRLLIGEGPSEKQVAAVAEFATAQLDLLRIRAVGREIDGRIDLDLCEKQELRRLAALDRYQRLAHTRRRRASYKLDVRDQEEDGRASSI